MWQTDPVLCVSDDAEQMDLDAGLVWILLQAGDQFVDLYFLCWCSRSFLLNNCVCVFQMLGTLTAVPIKVPQVSSLHRLAGQAATVLPQVKPLARSSLLVWLHITIMCQGQQNSPSLIVTVAASSWKHQNDEIKVFLLSSSVQSLKQSFRFDLRENAHFFFCLCKSCRVALFCASVTLWAASHTVTVNTRPLRSEEGKRTITRKKKRGAGRWKRRWRRRRPGKKKEGDK